MKIREFADYCSSRVRCTGCEHTKECNTLQNTELSPSRIVYIVDNNLELSEFLVYERNDTVE